MSIGSDLALHLFLQIAIILATCRLVSLLLRYVHQPTVIGEMVAGVLLGPSLLGLVVPSWQHWLFPQTLSVTIGDATRTIIHPSLSVLYVVGQLGLVLYMFLIGLRFDTDFIRRHVTDAGRLALASILLPAVLGGLVGYLLASHRTFFPITVAPWQAALFLGCALAVTALPVLARIIDDLGIGPTRVAILALGAAATCDATAWSLFAVIIATTNHSPAGAFLALGGGATYTVVMLVIGSSVLKRLERHAFQENEVRIEVLAGLLMLLMLCAWYTDVVGLHAVFGAFVLGAVMPKGRVTAECQRLLGPAVVALLLPVYFAYSGLNTRIGFLTDRSVLIVLAIILFVAFVSKGGASMLACRLGGSTWREGASLGALMNARGVMELALVNVGLQKGLITPTLFTVLVLMTIVTTISASPLFQLLYRPRPTQAGEYEVGGGTAPVS
jgi:Kef-type K+ transport system membrane component KefB